MMTINLKEMISEKAEELTLANKRDIDNLSADEITNLFTRAEVLIMEDLYIKADNKRKETR